MKLCHLGTFLVLLSPITLHGIIVRETIMERHIRDKAPERVIILHDYHKPIEVVGEQQSQKIVEVFTAIKHRDPTAELILERPVIDDIHRMVSDASGVQAFLISRIMSSVANVGVKAAFAHWLQDAGKLFGFKAPCLLPHDFDILIPSCIRIVENFLKIPMFSGSSVHQLLEKVGQLSKSLEGVTFLDYRVSVVNVLIMYLTYAIFSALLYETSLYPMFKNGVHPLAFTLQQMIGFIQHFIVQSSDYCEYALQHAPKHDLTFRDQFLKLKNALELQNIRLFTMEASARLNRYENASIADVFINGAHLLYGKQSLIPGLSDTFTKEIGMTHCPIDAYQKLLMIDECAALVKFCVSSPHLGPLFDVWLIHKIFTSQSKTKVVVTGSLHAENVVEYLYKNGFEMILDTHAYFVNGLRIDSLKPFYAFTNMGVSQVSNYGTYSSATESVTHMFDAMEPTDSSEPNGYTWNIDGTGATTPDQNYYEYHYDSIHPETRKTVCDMIKSAGGLQSRHGALQKLYLIASIADASLLAIANYFACVDLMPLNNQAFDYALWPADELRSLHGCCSNYAHRNVFGREDGLSMNENRELCFTD